MAITEKMVEAAGVAYLAASGISFDEDMRAALEAAERVAPIASPKAMSDDDAQKFYERFRDLEERFVTACWEDFRDSVNEWLAQQTSIAAPKVFEVTDELARQVLQTYMKDPERQQPAVWVSDMRTALEAVSAELGRRASEQVVGPTEREWELEHQYSALEVVRLHEFRRAEKAEAELAELRDMFQRTHHVHYSWVARADRADALEAELARSKERTAELERELRAETAERKRYAQALFESSNELAQAKERIAELEQYQRAAKSWQEIANQAAARLKQSEGELAELRKQVQPLSEDEEYEIEWMELDNKITFSGAYRKRIERMLEIFRTRFPKPAPSVETPEQVIARWSEKSVVDSTASHAVSLLLADIEKALRAQKGGEP